MNINILTLTYDQLPEKLHTIPQPPSKLYYAGALLSELLEAPSVAIVGARAITPYGRQVTAMLGRQLAERGIIVISGLALGVDACAQQAALQAGGRVISVLPGPLDHIVPSTNRRLAQAILDNGGTLVSEYAPGTASFKGNFIERNRLMSGLADAVLITEAARPSGSLHTADFAADQGRLVLAVPGNITSSMSAGTNYLIQTGATPVASCRDVLEAMNLTASQTTLALNVGRNPQEQAILDLIHSGITDSQQLMQRSGLSSSIYNQTVSMLEISGKITSLGRDQWGR